MEGAERKRVVIDASALVDQLWQSDMTVVERLSLHAPTLIDYEYHSAIRRRTGLGEIRESEASAAIGTFAALNITRHPAHRLLMRMWDMRDNITTYDASYVALAEALGAPLMTADRRLARAANIYCEVIAI